MQERCNNSEERLTFCFAFFLSFLLSSFIYFLDRNVLLLVWSQRQTSLAFGENTSIQKKRTLSLILSLIFNYIVYISLKTKFLISQYISYGKN